jgi:hypothetical protein
MTDFPSPAIPRRTGLPVHAPISKLPAGSTVSALLKNPEPRLVDPPRDAMILDCCEKIREESKSLEEIDRLEDDLGSDPVKHLQLKVEILRRIQLHQESFLLWDVRFDMPSGTSATTFITTSCRNNPRRDVCRPRPSKRRLSPSPRRANSSRQIRQN